MGKGVLGGFEHHVLLAVLHLGDDGAFTVPVVDMVERFTGKAPAPAAVFTTLRRLEEQGLLRSEREPSPRGGRPRRVFYAEPQALRILRESRQTLERFWSGLSELEESAS